MLGFLINFTLAMQHNKSIDFGLLIHVPFQSLAGNNIKAVGRDDDKPHIAQFDSFMLKQCRSPLCVSGSRLMTRHRWVQVSAELQGVLHRCGEGESLNHR